MVGAKITYLFITHSCHHLDCWKCLVARSSVMARRSHVLEACSGVCSVASWISMMTDTVVSDVEFILSR